MTKKIMAFIMTITLTLSMSYVGFATSVESIENKIINYNIDVIESSITVPIKTLQQAAKFDSANQELKQFVNSISNNAENFVMSSEEVFELLVLLVIPEERDEYLASYKNQTLEISYENGSFFVYPKSESIPLKKSSSVWTWSRTYSFERTDLSAARRSKFSLTGTFKKTISGNYTYLEAINVSTSNTTFANWTAFSISGSSTSLRSKITLYGQGPLQPSWVRWEFTSYGGSAYEKFHDVKANSF